MVVSEASLAQQAAAFVEANQDRVAVSTFQLFRARLVAGEHKAKTTAKIAKIAGIVIPEYPKPSNMLAACETLAVGTLQKLLDSYAEEHLTVALRAAAQGMANKPGELRAALLYACAKVISSEPEGRKITSYLKALGKRELEKQSFQLQSSRGCSGADAVEFILRRVLDGRQTALPKDYVPVAIAPLVEHFRTRGESLVAVNSIFTLFRLNGRRLTLEELRDVASRQGLKVA